MTDVPRYGAHRDEHDYAPPRGGYDAPVGSIAGLLQNIIGNVQDIIRSEVRLAKAEVREEAASAARAAALLAVGVVLGLYAVGLLLLTFVYALRGPVPDWLAALIVFVVVAIVAGALVMLGMQRIKQVNPKPDETIDSIKEDVRWVKQQTR